MSCSTNGYSLVTAAMPCADPEHANRPQRLSRLQGSIEMLPMLADTDTA
jgi:hypothetical protein